MWAIKMCSRGRIDKYLQRDTFVWMPIPDIPFEEIAVTGHKIVKFDIGYFQIKSAGAFIIDKLYVELTKPAKLESVHVKVGPNTQTVDISGLKTITEYANPARIFLIHTILPNQYFSQLFNRNEVVEEITFEMSFAETPESDTTPIDEMMNKCSISGASENSETSLISRICCSVQLLNSRSIFGSFDSEKLKKHIESLNKSAEITGTPHYVGPISGTARIDKNMFPKNFCMQKIIPEKMEDGEIPDVFMHFNYCVQRLTGADVSETHPLTSLDIHDEKSESPHDQFKQDDSRQLEPIFGENRSQVCQGDGIAYSGANSRHGHIYKFSYNIFNIPFVSFSFECKTPIYIEGVILSDFAALTGPKYIGAERVVYQKNIGKTIHIKSPSYDREDIRYIEIFPASKILKCCENIHFQVNNEMGDPIKDGNYTITVADCMASSGWIPLVCGLSDANSDKLIIPFSTNPCAEFPYAVFERDVMSLTITFGNENEKICLDSSGCLTTESGGLGDFAELTVVYHYLDVFYANYNDTFNRIY